MEAKGHTSSSPALGSRKLDTKSYQQGHPKYIEAIILEMQKQPKSKETTFTISVLKKAIITGNLNYKVVHQHITESGTLGKINISDYKQG
ncbi:hypothetical protein K6U59_05860 [Vibrio vulnificus]|uniref:hypothetical protein n=1 Tax=Vibrio vulnificus TaxID=672 RepID=UPI001EEBB989|nr:hypothetical protein [Vibrio vulnificus]MCG6276399.1 hypothetical protein [Vibrio vulnificus]